MLSKRFLIKQHFQFCLCVHSNRIIPAQFPFILNSRPLSYTTDFKKDTEEVIKDTVNRINLKADQNHSDIVKGKEPVDTENINKAVREGIENTKSQVNDIKDSFTGKSKEYTERAKVYTDKAKASVHTVKKEVKDKAKDVKEGAQDFTEKAKEKVHDIKESVKETAHNIKEKVKDCTGIKK
jgi:methyl-accepting chemotaxis protein